MKKVLKGLLFAFVGVFTLVALASCGGNSHTHVAKEGWKRDSAQHWHECESCDEMLDATAHTYGAWTVDVEVDHANNKNGRRHKTCSVCGFQMNEDIQAMPVFYVRGGINGWGTGDEWKLTIDTEKATATITGVKFEEVGAEWKIATDDWKNEANAGNLDDAAKEYFEGNAGENIKVKVAGTYTITVSDLLGSKTISVVKTA